MVNFTVDQIRSMMYQPQYIRNISVIAHVDHGKSTLTDSLIAKAGIIAEGSSGSKRFTDGRKDEKDRGITIKSTSVSLYYERDEGGPAKQPYLINLIDSPGHVDFSSEVTAALRVTDGALVVVDCIEGVCVQTETVLRQAISERIRPVLFLNKMDRFFLEVNPTLEECYTNLRNSIESVNVVCQTYRDEKLGDVELMPDTGKVGFGSGYHAWGFTLADFAKMYASRFGLSAQKMMKRLWGNHFWDPASRTWSKKNTDSSLTRSFCQFVLKPIKVLIDAVVANEKEVYEPIISALGLKFDKKDLDEASESGKAMVKLVMRTWIPAGNALLDMISEHLPSPVDAQAYRAESLYTGPPDSEELTWVEKCDSDAPLSMYVSKMVPTDGGRFLAFGRVFSGCVKAGTEVRILGPDYEPGGKRDLHVKKIQRVYVMMGAKPEQITDVPCGNVCGLAGVDQYLLKSGTVTSSESFHPFHTMKFSVAAVVQVAVEPKSAADLPKLVEGLKRLVKSDPLVKTSVSKTGQHIIAGAGGLHLEICLNDLRDEYMKGAEIVVSEPVVSYAETVTQVTGADDKYPAIVISKSPNKLNRLWCSAQPLDAKFTQAVADGDVKLAGTDPKTFGRLLADEYGWESSEARKIWTFGCPPDGVANCLVDVTKGVQYLTEARDSVVSAFMEVTNGGVLCDEVMRGVRCNIHDVRVHSDPAHRGVGQISPMARRVFYAGQLASAPRLLEPMYLVDVVVKREAMSGVFSTLSSARGETESIVDRIGTPLTNIKAFVPVAESFELTGLLRKNTGGQAFPQMVFSHWKVVDSDPMADGTAANAVVRAARARKGLKLELPKFADYYDKL